MSFVAYCFMCEKKVSALFRSELPSGAPTFLRDFSYTHRSDKARL
jgi:hypothetical protein